MEQHEHLIIDADKHFIIDPITRTITNQTSNKTSLMQYDHNSERFTFQIPRKIENHDMSITDTVQVHYVNTSSGTSVSARTSNYGIYTVQDLQINPDDPDTVIGSWLISENATQKAGTLSFLFKFVCFDEDNNVVYKWHSNLYSNIEVLSGLNNDGTIAELIPDVILQLEERIEDLSNMPELMEELMKDHIDPLEERVATNETKIQKIIDDLNYVKIAINSFSATPSTAEIGSTVNTITLDWALNKIPTELTVDGEAVDVETEGMGIANAGITANKTWTLAATDERGASASKTASLTFLNGVYYGVSAAPEAYYSAFILGLTKELRSSKKSSISVNAGEGQYIYYCLPTRFGTCSFTVGGFSGGFTLVDTLSFTNASGYEEDYYIYKSDNAELGSTSVTIA